MKENFFKDRVLVKQIRSLLEEKEESYQLDQNVITFSSEENKISSGYDFFLMTDWIIYDNLVD
jgi:hypothetical protein